MTTSKYRGHKIECINEIWIYSDNKKPVSEDINRRCGNCEKANNAEEHDPCLGKLKGIMNACCGHGVIKDCYVQFLDGFSLHGVKAKIVLDILKGV